MEKPHKCKICSKAFSLEGNMRRHKMTHSEDRLFQCSECSRTFKNKENLKVHVKRIHLKIQSFKCQDCPSQFTTNVELQSLWKRIHMVISWSFTCNECEKTFRLEEAVKRHQHRVHVGNKKNICNICHKYFYSKMDLKKHESVHTEERPHKCSIYQAGF